MIANISQEILRVNLWSFPFRGMFRSLLDRHLSQFKGLSQHLRFFSLGLLGCWDLLGLILMAFTVFKEIIWGLVPEQEEFRKVQQCV